MYHHLKMVRHDNNPPLFSLEGHLTTETIPTFVINVKRGEAFILDLEKLDLMDKAGAQALTDLAEYCKFVIWNAPPHIERILKRKKIKTTFLPK